MNIIKQKNNFNEQELLEKVAEGDLDAFADVYNYYVPKLYRFAYPFTNQNKEDTEEVIQNVFLKIWMRKEKLVTVRSFDAYLFRMAKNHLIDLKKQINSKQRIVDEITPSGTTYVTSAHDKLVYNEYYHSAKAALSLLTPQRRKIFEMRTEMEMSIDEIAKTLDISQSAVKKQLYEAIKQIKKHLSHEVGWPVLLWFLTILS